MTPEERAKYETQSIQIAIGRIDHIKQALMLIWEQHMMGNPNFPRGMVERAKLVVEQLLESKGIELDYKKPKEEKKSGLIEK